MSQILACVWPVTDETYSTRELVAEATGDLDRLAEQAHAVIIGPPFWSIQPAAEVPGWNAYAPGLVLVAYAPVEVVTTATDVVGRKPANVAARRALSAELSAAGWTPARIAAHVGVNPRTIFRDLARAAS